MYISNDAFLLAKILDVSEKQMVAALVAFTVKYGAQPRMKIMMARDADMETQIRQTGDVSMASIADYLAAMKARKQELDYLSQPMPKNWKCGGHVKGEVAEDYGVTGRFYANDPRNPDNINSDMARGFESDIDLLD